jgi:hypothetical protein
MIPASNALKSSRQRSILVKEHPIRKAVLSASQMQASQALTERPIERLRFDQSGSGRAEFGTAGSFPTRVGSCFPPGVYLRLCFFAWLEQCGLDERLRMRRYSGVVLAFGMLLLLAGCAAKTTGATSVSDGSATLSAVASCDSGQTCTWYWEYWRANAPRSSSQKTAVEGPVQGPTGNVNLSITVNNLDVSTAYRWVFCASPNDGAGYACTGPHSMFGSTTADPPPDYDTFTTAPLRTLAEAWNGRTWTIQPAPNQSGSVGGDLSGISCTSATSCIAVGNANSAGGDVTLAERWDGTSWTIQPTPNPSGATDSDLSAVSCTSASACTAVGVTETAPSANSAGSRAPLAERWDGTSWTIQPTPSPSGEIGGAAGGSALLGASCTSATACTAVGYFVNGNPGNGTLAETWDGASWTIKPTPDQSGATSTTLASVSCTSATACTAVGSAGSAGTVAERWDGTSWTIQPTPNGSGLSGVSCTSSSACTAVGPGGTPPDGATTLAEAWDGTTWTVQPSPNESGAPGSSMSGVSCTSATGCTAAGSYVTSTLSYLTLAERWDGASWTIQPTPNPSGPTSFLNGVSCTSATACIAVGYH